MNRIEQYTTGLQARPGMGRLISVSTSTPATTRAAATATTPTSREDGERLMSERAAARLLDLRPVELAALRGAGHGPVHSRFAGRCYYAWSDLEQWKRGR